MNTSPDQKTSIEQKRLNIGLRVWMWGTAIQLVGVAVFTLAHLAILLAHEMGWLTRQLQPAVIKAVAVAGLIYNAGLILAWGCKTYGAARLMRPIGDRAFNLSTLVARLLMVIGSTVVFYCTFARLAQALFAEPGKPVVMSMLWTLPVPFNALYLIGAASLAVLIAKHAGTIRTGLFLALLFMLGVVPDLISLMTLRAQAALAEGETLGTIYQVAAALSTLLLTGAVLCELVAVRKLRAIAVRS